MTQQPAAADGDLKRCFVVTPIGGRDSEQRRHADMVFEVALKPLFEEQGYTLERADMATEPGQITAAIFSALAEADVCVADLSFLNPNVMYELGIRHALRKPVIQIAAHGTALPFDTSHQRTIFFDSGDVHSLRSLSEEVRSQLEWIVSNVGPVSNPLTSAIGLFDTIKNGDPPGELVNDLAARLTRLEKSVSGMIPGTAAAILGQGDLATKNTREIRQLWQADLVAATLNWVKKADDSLEADYRGFKLTVQPESRGRWSSHAVETETGFSVPWPVWQGSISEAQTAIVQAVDDARPQ